MFIDESFEPFELSVRSLLSGVPVEGHYQQVESTYWAWKASAPMPPGEYVIETVVPEGTTASVWHGAFSTAFEVIEAEIVTPPTLRAEPGVSTRSEAQNLVCCTLWTELGVETGDCAPTEERTLVSFDPSMTSPDALVSVTQFLYARWPAGEADAVYGFSPWGAMPSFWFEAAADEYCFEIEALSINDLSRHRYTELEGRCQPHGSLPALGAVPLALPPAFFERARCTALPAGEEAAWCEVNADCADTPQDYACSLFDHVCNDGPIQLWTPPPSLIAGAGGAGGAGGEGARGGSGGAGGTAGLASSGADGADTVGAAGMTQSMAMNAHPASSGCSMAHATGAASSGPFALLVALAFLVRRRSARTRQAVPRDRRSC